MGYDTYMEVRYTPQFEDWLNGLRDRTARSRILVRIERVREGNFGDHKIFDGIGELRFAFGPGYRVYFVQLEDVVVLLLCGGDKGTQSRDIDRAKALAKEL